MKKIYFVVLAFCFIGNLNAQIINFPDPNLKAKLLQSASWNYIAQSIAGPFIKIDANSDGEIQISEALNIKLLDLGGNANLSNLSGIQNFANLLTLTVGNNPLLTTMDLTGLNSLTYLNCPNNSLVAINNIGTPNLEKLDCYNNQITTIDVSNWPNLKELLIGDNPLTSLSISNMPTMERLFCGDTQLTSLTLQNLPNLNTLDCQANQLSGFTISGLGNVINFICNGNQFSEIDLSVFPLATFINVSNNLLETVDASMLYYLTQLNCTSNPNLTSIFCKNGMNESLSFDWNMQSLQYICVDDVQLDNVQANVNFYNLTNCFVNSYCSFVPGGIYYTLTGNNKLDNDNNGCNSDDLIIPNLKFAINSSNISGTFISNVDGEYIQPVGAGTHTITPLLQYPEYFNVSPTSVMVDFPAQASPLLQDYCIVPNGFHPDMEVTMIPFLSARPGFDAYYTIVCKNNGNITQSGTVSIQFNDAVLDFVTATPTTSSVGNSISWSFTNLEPFQTQLFGVVLNVNSPMETPAVNGGDVLNFTASVTTSYIDDTPTDNISTLNQIVVNSFDPNDKTCLEGTTISPSMVGEYVHYMIRFENNGTANAENIVVKDLIDTAKFDVATLVPIHGSHSFVSRITATNKVEFIFENINLPFDNANNDGYVAFKIKTKPTLVVGDTFSNSASIYFDYNFPIVTNTATTAITALATQDFEFESYFSVYPNPAKSTLNIETKATIGVKSINIYNAIGQLVIAIPNAEIVTNIDVSNLITGTYFIKMNTDKGTANTKFIKE